MPAFSLTPVQGFPQTVSEEFPNPLLFSLDDVMFNGPIQIVNFTGGTVTEREIGILDVTLGGGGVAGVITLNTLDGHVNLVAGSNVTIEEVTGNAIRISASGSQGPPGPPAVPGGLDMQLQFNDDGVFGGIGFPSGPAIWWEKQNGILYFGAQHSVNNYEGWQAAYSELRMFGNASLFPHQHEVFISPTNVTQATPSGSFLTPFQSIVHVYGGNSASDPLQGLNAAWMVPLGFHFEDYATGHETRYIDIKPMSRSGAPIAVPANFPTGIEVVIGGTPYWLPLIAQ